MNDIGEIKYTIFLVGLTHNWIFVRHFTSFNLSHGNDVKAKWTEKANWSNMWKMCLKQNITAVRYKFRQKRYAGLPQFYHTKNILTASNFDNEIVI